MTAIHPPDEVPIADGYLHEIGFYGSDADFRAVIEPFAREGLEAGEPVVFAYDPYKMDLLHRWLPDHPGITYITDAGPYQTPTRALASWRKVVEGHLDAGAPRVRIAGNVPHPGYGRPYAGWDRYEAAVDRAIGDLPVWAPCLYDTRIAPPEVVEKARSLHRCLLDGTDHVTNSSYEPARRLADFLTPDPDPIEQTAPQLDLHDPTPSAVRTAIRELVNGSLGADACNELLLAASEAVTNAIVHGAPPVTVQGWLGPDRVVVVVHDRGPGPDDPLVGLLAPSPPQTGTSGRGLWISHQLALDVALVTGPDGFSVRLTAPRLGPGAG